MDSKVSCNLHEPKFPCLVGGNTNNIIHWENISRACRTKAVMST